MEWKFSQLDEDRDGVLKKQELKTFRETIQKVRFKWSKRFLRWPHPAYFNDKTGDDYDQEERWRTIWLWGRWCPWQWSKRWRSEKFDDDDEIEEKHYYDNDHSDGVHDNAYDYNYMPTSGWPT
jgi:hypothetical protein